MHLLKKGHLLLKHISDMVIFDLGSSIGKASEVAKILNGFI